MQSDWPGISAKVDQILNSPKFILTTLLNPGAAKSFLDQGSSDWTQELMKLDAFKVPSYLGQLTKNITDNPWLQGMATSYFASKAGLPNVGVGESAEATQSGDSKAEKKLKVVERFMLVVERILALKKIPLLKI